MSAGGIIAVSTISVTDRIKSVRDLLVAGLVIETERVFLGRQFINMEGDGIRIVFVPTGVAAGPVLEMSNREGGANQWEVSAHIWGLNTVDDYGFDQFAKLETLIVELQGALRIVAGGRIKMSTIAFADTTHVLKYGESAVFSFSFHTNFQMVPPTQSLPAGPTTATATVREVS